MKPCWNVAVFLLIIIVELSYIPIQNVFGVKKIIIIVDSVATSYLQGLPRSINFSFPCKTAFSLKSLVSMIVRQPFCNLKNSNFFGDLILSFNYI